MILASRRLRVAGLLAGGALLAARTISLRRIASGPLPAVHPWPALPPPTTPVAPTLPAWVEPSGRDCPPGFPVKAKQASGIYHLPGMFAYERTLPDRCYRSPEAAAADGYRPAKR